MLRFRFAALLVSTALMTAPAWAQEEVEAPEAASGSDAAARAAAVAATRPTVAPIPETWAPVPVDADDRSAYGLYLAGRLAVSRGEGALGADYLALTNRLTPEQPRVRDQAFTAALLSGDLTLAGAIAPKGEGVSPVLSEAGKLVAAVQTFAAGDARSAHAALTASPVGRPHARAAQYVGRWIAAAADDWDAALAPVPETGDITALIMRGDRARLLELRGRHEEAEATWRELIAAAPSTAALFRLPFAEFLERRGRRADALAIYDAAIAAGAEDLQTQRARDRAAGRRRAPAAPTFAQGAAGALSVAAQQASAAERAHEFAAVYLRLSLNVAPNSLRRFQLGETLVEAGFETRAREAYAAVPPDDAVLYAASRIEIARSLQRDDQPEAALAETARAYAADPQHPGVALAHAQQLITVEKYEEALVVLRSPVLNTADQGWAVRFLRGAAYESLGRAAEAEAELWAALQIQPDDPMVLNYLGYLWVDSGTRVEEGAEMIARAFAAQPDSGNIQDSLGWAQYRQGDFEGAVINLEEAVAKEPANAEINDHLGDAYWRVGRRREAGFQWTRVLTLEPGAERQASVERKLAHGLADDDDGSGGGGRP